jgi:AraC-like DNA-binding protein
MENQLLIKNMVCPRCIEAVREVFLSENLDAEIELGKVTLKTAVINEQKEALAERLKVRGFELLEPGKSALISQIKSLIIDQIHHSNENLAENYSTFIAEKLDQEYTSLSKLFSQAEGITIEKFVTRQKIERIKELLFYDQLTLSEIAFQLNYSSVAYLSSQFKKETGITPSEFKRSHANTRTSLDRI